MYTRAKGFTLIELLVVIAIIGLLSTIITANLMTARGKARDAKRIADVRTIQLALETYFNDNGAYPAQIYGASGLAPTYLPVIPFDPLSGTCTTSGASVQGCYYYVAYNASYTAVCNAANPIVGYHLATTLEQKNNSALTQDVDGINRTACTSSGVTDFHGLSAVTNSAGNLCNATAGTAQPSGTETCYDLTH
jgi:prepilin-type N-terminal cleavage/methylation domain-containing protein